jgi:hypothetical protein
MAGGAVMESKNTRGFVLVISAFVVAVFLSASVSAQSQAVLAKAVVSNLYKAKPSPFFQTKDRALVDKYFTKDLADMIWKDAVTANGEVGAIDGDPLYNAQDTQIKALMIGSPALKGTSGTVLVTFTNFGKKQAITYQVKKTAKCWRIDDIVYDKTNSLRKWLKNG